MRNISPQKAKVVIDQRTVTRSITKAVTGEIFYTGDEETTFINPPGSPQRMELNVLENKKNRMVFEIKGADHTFCNALKQELWQDENITVAAYNIAHPLVSSPKFIVEGKGDIKDALLGASTRLQKRNKDFLAAFQKL